MTGTLDGCPGHDEPTSADVLGVRIHALDEDGALAALHQLRRCHASHVVNHLPAHPTVLASRDETFRQTLNAADLNLADGMGVVLACRAQGIPLRGRVYGPDFMLRVLGDSEHRWGTQGLLGGSPDTLELLERNLRRRFPDMNLVAAHAPPFRDITDDSVREDLANLGARPDVLWVGLGTPKQQRWAHIARRMDAAGVILTVGAAFDFFAGAKPQAPAWMRNSGLEWLFRMASEPRRLWRRALVDNAAFVLGVARTSREPRQLHERSTGRRFMGVARSDVPGLGEGSSQRMPDIEDE